MAEVYGRRCGFYTLRLTFTVGCGEGMAHVLGANRFHGELKVGQTHSRGVSDHTAFGKFPIENSTCTAIFSQCPIRDCRDENWMGNVTTTMVS